MSGQRWPGRAPATGAVDYLAERFAEGFTADMRAAGVHVGLGLGGGPVTCAACGEPWPCSTERTVRPGS